MKWFGAVLQVLERLPIERFLVKPPDNKKNLQELQKILSGAKPTPAEPPEENPAEAIPPEYEDLKGFLVPRENKVHIQSPPSDGVSIEDTVTYQNREIGKLLLRMERHYAQRLRINGVACDCGSTKHLLDLESLCEETVPMVDNPDAYYRIIEWAKDASPKSTDRAAKSGQYDDVYPVFSRQARDFRKEVMGSLEPAALFGKKAEELLAPEDDPTQHIQPGVVPEGGFFPDLRPADTDTDTLITDEEFEQQRKDLLSRGFIT